MEQQRSKSIEALEFEFDNSDQKYLSVLVSQLENWILRDLWPAHIRSISPPSIAASTSISPNPVFVSVLEIINPNPVTT